MGPIREIVTKHLRRRETARPVAATSRRRRFWLPAAVLLLGAALWLHPFQESASPMSDAGAATVPGEIVIEFREDLRLDQVQEVERRYGISLRQTGSGAVRSRRMVATVDPARRDQVLSDLQRERLVEVAEKQYIYGALQSAAAEGWVPNDPNYRQQWHLRYIGLENAWRRTRGAGAVVAVVDSGYRQSRDFAPGRFVPGYDFIENDAEPQDENGHGSHVAGTIGEETNNGVAGAGVAPEAKLMILRVLDGGGRGPLSAILDAVQYAADHGAHVVNLSLGGGPYSKMMEKMLRYAIGRGVMPVCAAGNSGRRGVAYPARYEECLAVGAVGPSGRRARYSTWGPELDLAGPGGDLSAGPEGGIWQSAIVVRRGLFSSEVREGFIPMQGTSMAAPHVAGVAALLVSAGCREPGRIRALLQSTARRMANREEYGSGILDAAAAVQAVSEVSKPVQVMEEQRSAAWLLLGLAAAWASCKSRVVAIAAGFLLPVLGDFGVPPGSLANLLLHSAALPAAVAISGVCQRLVWLAGGIAAHLGAELVSRGSVLDLDPTRAQSWVVVNGIVCAYLLWVAGSEESEARMATKWSE